MVTLNENVNDKIRKTFAKDDIFIIFESKLRPMVIGVEAESLDKVRSLPFVDKAEHELIGTLMIN